MSCHIGWCNPRCHAMRLCRLMPLVGIYFATPRACLPSSCVSRGPSALGPGWCELDSIQLRGVLEILYASYECVRSFSDEFIESGSECSCMVALTSYIHDVTLASFIGGGGLTWTILSRVSGVCSTCYKYELLWLLTYSCQAPAIDEAYALANALQRRLAWKRVWPIVTKRSCCTACTPVYVFLALDQAVGNVPP